MRDIERLIARSCANCVDGICLQKDAPCVWREMDINPDTGKPYPFSDKGITCHWLRKAVLPGDP
ncbi:MAG: hypothetical protein GXY84_04765 [Clostridiales bacterium]|nr:hypothetical protein [Clostridiales bacterium]